MDAETPEALAAALSERAEFYLCLSRAFLAPRDPAVCRGLREALADDLEGLAANLGYDLAAPLADYRAAIAAVPDDLALLQVYSGLFLAPPREVQINTATYLDGALNGGSVAALEALYRAAGVERSDGFRDLADHLAVQLEFAAVLYARQAAALTAGGHAALPTSAAEFLYQYPGRWLPRFLADLERVDREQMRPDNPYLPLARMLAAAVAADAVAPQLPAGEQRAAQAIGKARQARAARGIDAEDLQIIAEKLQAHGLATDHLAIPHDARDEARGWSRKVPPSPRRGARWG